jgi:hypothetical protein
MALLGNSRESLSVVPRVLPSLGRTLATGEPVNGIRIAAVGDTRETERLLTTHLASAAWRLMARLDKGEIELFRASNNVGTEIAIIVSLKGQSFIEILHPIKDGLTTAKALGMIGEAVRAAGYQFSERLDQSIIDRNNATWRLGSLPDRLDLACNWTVLNGGVIDLPKILNCDGSVTINATTIRKRFMSASIGGDLDFSFSQISSLPGDLNVARDLVVNDTSLLLIEDGASIGGALRANGCRLEWFSSRIRVGSDVDLGNTPLKEFDEDVTICGKLWLDNVPAKALGRNLNVKDSAVMTGTGLVALPDDSLFEGDLYIDNPELIIPRSTHILGRLLLRADVGYQIIKASDMRRA